MRGRHKTIQHYEDRLIALVESGELEIDSQGRVWRHLIRRGNRIQRIKRRRAECQPEPDGYLMVRAMIDGKRIHTTAQRLVWRHFKGPIPKGLTVNHKDGIKPRNHPGNLELASYSDQMKHAYRTGLKEQWGERNPAAILSNSDVEEIRRLYAQGNVLQIDLAKRFGVRFQQISRIVHGERRTKQTGATSKADHRFATAQDKVTGRFMKKEALCHHHP